MKHLLFFSFHIDSIKILVRIVIKHFKWNKMYFVTNVYKFPLICILLLDRKYIWEKNDIIEDDK